MSLPVVWSEEAGDDAAAIISYIVTTFGKDSAIKAIDQLEETIDCLSFFPYLGEKYNPLPP